jgi:hypothetical protein
MVIGDKRKFLSCLVTLKVDVDPETTAPLNTLAPEALEALKRFVEADLWGLEAAVLPGSSMALP